MMRLARWACLVTFPRCFPENPVRDEVHIGAIVARSGDQGHHSRVLFRVGVLVDGEVAGAINRLPGEGEIRSNLAVGGKAAKTELTAREEEICAALGPELKKRGLLFAGIDVIGGKWLTEINVTSPTGIVAIDKFNGSDTPGLIWQAIERRLGN